MTAAAKRYRYLRRLFKFKQMDFQYAAWQMFYLFVSPQRVYRNFQYRKRVGISLHILLSMSWEYCFILIDETSYIENVEINYVQ
ncbi:Protein unc-50-like protein [Armadillidium vulgare]|nr:Protein unc-50-like protein [Armadillidium vulgare]